MAKAQITTRDGTKVTIEGTPSEVAALLARLEGGAATRPSRETNSRLRKTTAKAGPVSLVSELIDGGFFKKPKELSAIKLALEEQGHFYPVTTLSPLLLRLVRKRELRRIKDKKRWLYVG
jgi:hypothetical protein